jgi:hypothetical protein
VIDLASPPALRDAVDPIGDASLSTFRAQRFVSTSNCLERVDHVQHSFVALQHIYNTADSMCQTYGAAHRRGACESGLLIYGLAKLVDDHRRQVYINNELAGCVGRVSSSCHKMILCPQGYRVPFDVSVVLIVRTFFFVRPIETPRVVPLLKFQSREF